MADTVTIAECSVEGGSASTLPCEGHVSLWLRRSFSDGWEINGQPDTGPVRKTQDLN